MQLTPVIRYCIPEDLNSIIQLAKYSVNRVLPEEEYEEEKIVDLFNLALKNEDYAGICLLIDDVVCGYILGCITEQYFHSKKIAYCMSIFVKEDVRGYSLEMIRSFEAWGKYKGAETLSISSFAGLSPEKIKTVFKRLGYTEKEIVYWKEV